MNIHPVKSGRRRSHHGASTITVINIIKTTITVITRITLVLGRISLQAHSAF